MALISKRKRFLAKVDKLPSGCWAWRGARLAHGYGLFKWDWRDSGMTTAHRAAYKLLRGPVRKDRHVDHLCRRRWCVNPAHLEVVTRRENIRRGKGFAGKNAQKKRCKRGHRFDLLIDGKRRCRRCMNLNKRQGIARSRVPMTCRKCHQPFLGRPATSYTPKQEFCSARCVARAIHARRQR